MSVKRISPAAINALKEALTVVYWYKSDLRSFLTHALRDTRVLSYINWEDYKRTIASSVVDFLTRNEDSYQDALIRLMLDVAAMEDFHHLERLNDGANKAYNARVAVKALKEHVATHQEIVLEQESTEQRRQNAYEKRQRTQAVASQLEALRTTFYELVRQTSPQGRGYSLEQLIRELFELFDLDPKASFRIQGEQIDGAFSFEGTDYLLEAKWQQEPVGIDQLDAFSGKVRRKLDNTLGLFLSINGFSATAMSLHSSARPVMILMDGSDLMAVLEGRIELGALLLRKRRHASQTGEVFLPIHRLLG